MAPMQISGDKQRQRQTETESQSTYIFKINYLIHQISVRALVFNFDEVLLRADRLLINLASAILEIDNQLRINCDDGKQVAHDEQTS